MLLGATLLAPGCVADGIDFYREHLGRQWAFHCDYQPSCSTYGKQAVATYGAVPGSLMIADRLMRDHGLAPQDYPHDEYGRPIDPPGENALFGPRADAGEEAAAELAAREQQEIEGAPPPAALELDEDAQLRFADELFARGELERA